MRKTRVGQEEDKGRAGSLPSLFLFPHPLPLYPSSPPILTVSHIMKLSTFALLSLALPVALALPSPRSNGLAARGEDDYKKGDSKDIDYKKDWDHKLRHFFSLFSPNETESSPSAH